MKIKDCNEPAKLTEQEYGRRDVYSPGFERGSAYTKGLKK
jgi:hypothetical protein